MEQLNTLKESLKDTSTDETSFPQAPKIISKSTIRMQSDSNLNWTPTSQAGLGFDPDDEPYDEEEWNYASVVGMLIYISNNTRLDIAFSSSQVVQLTANPQKSHTVTFKTII